VAWAHRVDGSTIAAASALGLSTRTLRRWAATRCVPPDRGRPTHAITRVEATMIRLALALYGPHAGVATLQAWCPSASRRAITTWQRRRRRNARRRLQIVRWTGAGRIWATDFSEPPVPIDGDYPWVLHVRDLASQQHLAALPVGHPTASAVCDLLAALTATHAAPLVLKVDNGAAFGSHDLQAWAATHGTALLYSPPRCPRYNGSIEASIGALTTRAHHAAAAAGHPQHWTCADIEAARLQANAHASARVTRITAAERQRFQAHYRAACDEQDHATTRAQQRSAIAHTLQELGYVSITRRAGLVH
jgi:transposase InsO family protein